MPPRINKAEICQEAACTYIRDPLTVLLFFLPFEDISIRNKTFSVSHLIRTALEFLGDRCLYGFLGRALMAVLPDNIELYMPIMSALGSNLVLGEITATLKLHHKTEDKTGGDVFETLQGASIMDRLDNWEAVEERAVAMFTPIILACASALLDPKRKANSSNNDQPFKRGPKRRICRHQRSIGTCCCARCWTGQTHRVSSEPYKCIHYSPLHSEPNPDAFLPVDNTISHILYPTPVPPCPRKVRPHSIHFDDFVSNVYRSITNTSSNNTITSYPNKH
ncbi:hypothetical protein B0H16DRAFT_1712512 [Mycena metata]|uniref:Uncharacterized protein n=1 Tax=Mycena metata TaxID=1033252 RepID=A0AAD7K1A0_9AGAR|nr:hypothetical protein B0H16DRAFT_1712512 [Mycena metata]